MPTLLRTGSLPYAALTLLTALALGACGGGSSTTSGPAPAAGSKPASTGTAGAQRGQGQRQPGTTGLIAAVNGPTMQVQTRTDQTAVTWTDATTFTKQASATAADVTAGSCVTVVEPPSTSTATRTPGGAAPTEVTATAVQVRPATNGQCAGGFAGGGGPGGAGPGGGGAGATGAPTRTGTAGPEGGGGGFGRRGVNGLVTAVSGSTIAVQEAVRGGAGAGSASATAGTTQTVTVTTTGTTTYLAEKSATAADVAVGECATTSGKPDDTGAVAATAIALRPATNGSCTNGGGAGRPTGTATGSTGSANG